MGHGVEGPAGKVLNIFHCIGKLIYPVILPGKQSSNGGFTYSENTDWKKTY